MGEVFEESDFRFEIFTDATYVGESAWIGTTVVSYDGEVIMTRANSSTFPSAEAARIHAKAVGKNIIAMRPTWAPCVKSYFEGFNQNSHHARRRGQRRIDEIDRETRLTLEGNSQTYLRNQLFGHLPSGPLKR